MARDGGTFRSTLQNGMTNYTSIQRRSRQIALYIYRKIAR